VRGSIWVGIAALSGALSVVLGAWGAHALRDRLTPDQLVSWGTAVQYHLIHSLALLALGLYASATDRPVHLSAGLFTAGVLLFSGSIYLLVLGGPRWLGPVTPLGGLCLIAGWVSLLGLLRSGS
jgi:uncharacterized membrane protein YgdD (TMEM256/DUF423 family)